MACPDELGKDNHHIPTFQILAATNVDSTITKMD
jgi:hypothetical protein